MDDGFSGATVFQACYVELPARKGDGQSVTAQLSFPRDFAAFAGHFPEDPILPGFIQIELALDVLRRLNMATRLQAVRQAKFFLPIRPGQKVDALLASPDDLHFHLELKINGKLCTMMDITVG